MSTKTFCPVQDNSLARPREFNGEHALEGALQIFWKTGYNATNLPDLLKAMGLTRGSFYKAFGDKRSVYIEILKRYDQNYIGEAAKMLESNAQPNGEARILKLFDTGFEKDIPREERRGCLMCNAMVELGPTDATVAHLTSKMYARLQQAIHKALKDTVRPIESSGDILMQKAEIITNLYFGAQALSKSGQQTPDWQTLITAITRP